MPQSIPPSCERIAGLIKSLKCQLELLTSCILAIPICQPQIHNDKSCPSSTQSFLFVFLVLCSLVLLCIWCPLSASPVIEPNNPFGLCVPLIVFPCTVLRMVPLAPYQHLYIKCPFVSVFSVFIAPCFLVLLCTCRSQHVISISCNRALNHVAVIFKSCHSVIPFV
jgi:hypothetical protein